jgi:hypothetical protein
VENCREKIPSDHGARVIPWLLLFVFSITCGWTKEPQIFAEKAIFCGVCKNSAKSLPITIYSVEKAGSLFSDYRVFIYENNSTDGTVELLKKWAEQNQHVTVISETVTSEQLLAELSTRVSEGHPYRTELIARARNIVLEKALDPALDDYTYLFMSDTDFEFPWDTRGIIDSLKQTTSWDAICANGIGLNGRTYDRFALRTHWRPFGPELLGEAWWVEQGQVPFVLNRTAPLFPVFSAFGGLTIYKREALRGCRYSGVVTEELELQTARFIAENPTHPEVLAYLTRDDKHHEIVPLHPNGIRWILNSGCKVLPACCEHVTLHAAMAARGHNKIFINPRLIMRH